MGNGTASSARRQRSGDRGRRLHLAPMWALAMALAAYILAPPRAAATASAWASNPQSAVRLVSAYEVAPRHGEIRLGIQFRLAPRWHVYWKNSGDAGFAPVVAFAHQAGLSYPEMLWPAPHRFDLAGGLEAFGYADEVVYPVRAQLDTAADSLHLAADVDYLVCEVDCVPHRYNLTLDQRLGDRAELDPATAPLLASYWSQVPVAASTRAGVAVSGIIETPDAAAARALAGRRGQGQDEHAEGPRLSLSLRLQGVAAGPQGADLFFEVHPTLELGRPTLHREPDGLVFVVPVSRKDSTAPLPASATLAWTATGLRQGGAALAMAGNLRVPIVAPAVGPAAKAMAGDGSAAAGPADAGVPSATSAHPAAMPASGLRVPLAQADPRWVGILTAAAALLALDLWGMLRHSAAPPAVAPAATPAAREALGFVALLAVLGLLYALSLEVSPEGLAGTEAALLAMGLLTWLRRPRRSAAARILLALGIAACAAAPSWLAERSRLIYPRSGAALHGPIASQAPARPPS
jgi:DsbC/DsbD-like thiol-disulfide interchange protein